jgi:hypothetical protein
MFFKNKKIKKDKLVISPLVVSIQPSIGNPNLINHSLNSGLTTTSSSYIIYASGSTMTIDGLWDMEREMKRAERKNKIEEIFPELKSSLSDNINGETDKNEIVEQNGFG